MQSTWSLHDTQASKAEVEAVTAALEDRVAGALSRPRPPARADFRFRRIDTVLASTGRRGDGGYDGDGDRLGPLVLDLDQLFAQVSNPATTRSMTTKYCYYSPTKKR